MLGFFEEDHPCRCLVVGVVTHCQVVFANAPHCSLRRFWVSTQLEMRLLRVRTLSGFGCCSSARQPNTGRVKTNQGNELCESVV
mmetsp:Transcript_57940/g.154407  ORF Transcript_57940/g.154407 Transcript_57940/m.154407 type:complete len:84 (+) Transcript_57940:373-624(+)